MEEQHTSRLEAILNSAVDAIITIDELGRIESVNPATKTMFGYTESELIGRNVSMLMPSPFQEEHDEYLLNYLTSGIRKIIGIGREVIGKRKDGTTFPMHLAVSEIRIENKRAFTGIVRDISDLKEAQRRLSELNEDLEERVRERTNELRQAQAELVAKEKLATLGQISGGIAHEIRNPLNAVKTSVYFLLNAKHPTPAKTIEHLNRIDRQVTLIDHVITALSDVAKLPDPRLQPLSIENCLRGVLGGLTLPSNIEVLWDVSENVPPAIVDENQMSIVFRNLIRNARDAMEQGGQLTIHVSHTDGRIHVSIADNGSGIAPEDLPHVMEPLYSTKARGMGLGLAISKTIVEKNRGKIEVATEWGKGTEFVVSLDAARSGEIE